jgi:hypothetical protein
MESWSRGKWQAAGAIFEVGEVVLTLHPPLRPLSHNANPRDGAQDIIEPLSQEPSSVCKCWAI